MTFEVKEVSNIMDEMEYPGIRFTMNAMMGKLVTPMKIDLSTGDVITPRATEYNYKLLLDDRSINLWSYNLETILAEKLQTVLARGLLNTRMRDFYDIKTLLSIYEQDIDADVLKKAFETTCKKRNTENLKEEAPQIMAAVSDDAQLHTLWKSYQKKYASKPWETAFRWYGMHPCIVLLRQDASLFGRIFCKGLLFGDGVILIRKNIRTGIILW